MEPLSIASLVVAVIAAGIAIWQGVSSQRQLDLARGTEDETRRMLQEIRDFAQENRTTAAEIKSSIDERITKILDLRLDAERQELEAKRQSSEQGAEMAQKALGWLGRQVGDAIQQGIQKPNQTTSDQAAGDDATED